MAGEGRHEIADARDVHFTCHCWSSYESGASASFNLGIGVGNYDLALSDLEVDLFDFDEVVHVAAAGSRIDVPGDHAPFIGTGTLLASGGGTSSQYSFGPDGVNFDDPPPALRLYGTVTYTYAPTPPLPVPEPASWAMMIGGLALVGSALRRRAVPSARWHQDAGACA